MAGGTRQGDSDAGEETDTGPTLTSPGGRQPASDMPPTERAGRPWLLPAVDAEASAGRSTEIACGFSTFDIILLIWSKETGNVRF